MTPTEPIGLTIIVLQNDDGSHTAVYDCPICEVGKFRVPVSISPDRLTLMQKPGRYQCDNDECDYTLEVKP